MTAEFGSERTISIIIVSSPAASNPSLELLDAVINSFLHINGLENANIFIILDGYRIAVNEAHTKRGRITTEMAEAYEQYYANLLENYENFVEDWSSKQSTCSAVSSVSSENTSQSSKRRIFVKKSEIHLGFAHAVKLGLTLCGTKYCLVCQHDRMFIRAFPHLAKCIDIMEKHAHIRYIGWPSTTNCCHEQQVKYRYGLDCLTSMPAPPRTGAEISDDDTNDGNADNCSVNGDVDVSVADADEEMESAQIPLTFLPSQDPNHSEPVVDYKLQPLVFWFDSQHLCCVERYLEIYKPFTCMPEELQKREGAKGIAMFKLRSGDFIEDRFGQAQRTVLCKYKNDRKFVMELFRWFGCYLIWKINSIDEVNRVSIPHHPGANEAQRNNPVYLTRKSFNGPLGCANTNESAHIYHHALPFVTHMRGRQYDEEELILKIQRMESFAPPVPPSTYSCNHTCVTAATRAGTATATATVDITEHE